MDEVNSIVKGTNVIDKELNTSYWICISAVFSYKRNEEDVIFHMPISSKTTMEELFFRIATMHV